MYPLVYSLLPAKSQTVYTKLLTLLKDLCQQHHLQLQPSTIFLDYGVAIRNVAFTEYVTSYWVESNRHLWNHYQTDDPRTTNHLEGWHSQLKKHLATHTSQYLDQTTQTRRSNQRHENDTIRNRRKAGPEEEKIQRD